MAQKKKNTKNLAEKQAAKEKAAREKNLKLAAYIAAGVAVFVGLFFGILALSGVFSYTPEATNHASVLLDNGYTLHIELYGEDADVTVNNFLSLCQNGYTALKFVFRIAVTLRKLAGIKSRKSHRFAVPFP
jgi:hypothetical protein